MHTNNEINLLLKLLFKIKNLCNNKHQKNTNKIKLLHILIFYMKKDQLN